MAEHLLHESDVGADRARAIASVTLERARTNIGLLAPSNFGLSPVCERLSIRDRED